MRKSILLVFCIHLSLFITAQNQPKDPFDFISNYENTPQVLLVGTYHFSYPGLDGHKVDENLKTDILHPEKQKELEELLDYLERFKPTKIIVESGENTGYLMNRYRRWLKGEEELKRNERDQIGIKMMHRMNLDTIYGCDAGSMVKDIEAINGGEPYINNVFKEYDYQSDDPVDAEITEFYKYTDSITTNYTLLENFKYMNSEPYIRLMHGAYLVGDFKNDDNRGPDALSLFWYDRNLRIYRKIQQLKTQKEDRILVLFGAGHVPILKHLYESSPEYRLVPFNELEKY